MKYTRRMLPNVVSNMYIFFILTVFQLYMHNKYFDITLTRTLCFTIGTLVYLVLAGVSYVIDAQLTKESFLDICGIDEDFRFSLINPSIWMAAFGLANVLAWTNSHDKLGSFTGGTGRYFGLAMVLIITCMFLVLGLFYKPDKKLFIVFTLVIWAAVGIAALQHFSLDPFDLRKLIAKGMIKKFISTYGNINSYGTFLAMAVPVQLAVFTFAESKTYRIFAGIGIYLSAIGIIPAKSDNVYLGLAAACAVLLCLSAIEKKFTRFLAGIWIMVLSLFTMGILDSRFGGSKEHLNGLAELVAKPLITGAMLVAAGVLLGGSFVLKSKGVTLAHNVKRFVIIYTLTLLILMVLIFIVGRAMHLSIFVFDDTWGTYRGFVWKRSIELFCMGSLRQKLFGYGNETVYKLMCDHFYESMIKITNRTYDNCHNELLQYLVTTGIFGVISYVGLFVTGMWYMLRRFGGDSFTAAMIAACAGYFVQGLISLNQPINAPLYFVFLAAGTGYIRSKRAESR